MTHWCQRPMSRRRPASSNTRRHPRSHQGRLAQLRPARTSHGIERLASRHPRRRRTTEQPLLGRPPAALQRHTRAQAVHASPLLSLRFDEQISPEPEQQQLLVEMAGSAARSRATTKRFRGLSATDSRLNHLHGVEPRIQSYLTRVPCFATPAPLCGGRFAAKRVAGVTIFDVASTPGITFPETTPASRSSG